MSREMRKMCEICKIPEVMISCVSMESANFIRTYKWRRIRAMKISQQPLCEECLRQGRTVAGEEVDHIIPRSDGGGHKLSNLQTLCRPCHHEKTAKENGSFIHDICIHGFPAENKNWSCPSCP